MTKEELEALTRSCALLVQCQPDRKRLVEARDQLRMANDFGCFVDPTKWRDSLKDRKLGLELFDATIAFIDATVKIRDIIDANEAAERGG